MGDLAWHTSLREGFVARVAERRGWAMSVSLPRLGLLAVDFAASLFRLTVGDVESEEFEMSYVFKVVDVEKFGRKLGAILNKSEEPLRRIYNFLGGSFVARACGVGAVQDLAKIAAERPDDVIRQISTVRERVEGRDVVVEWGEGRLVGSPPPLLQSVEFMEGVRAWPASQLTVTDTGQRAKVLGGFRRMVRPSCLVLGALALGAGATYVAGGQREGVIRFLLPLTPVDFDIAVRDVAGRLTERLGGLGVCDLPELFTRLLVASLAGRPAVFRLVDVAYRGGIEVKRDSSRELIIDARGLGLYLSTLRRYADALLRLAREWCRCDREGWRRDECRDVERAGVAVGKLYLYMESGDRELVYEALSTLWRVGRDVAGVEGVRDLAGEVA